MKHLKDYVVVNGQEYYVSTSNTFDVGFETMVFESKDKYVTDWSEKFFKLYNTKEEAIEGHSYTINNLEKCLEEGKNQDWVKETDVSHFNWKSIERFFERLAEKEGNENE